MRESSSYTNIEKNLKHLAKRYKSVKYSIGLAILFLMMGLNAFSEEILEKESLHNSVKTLQEKIQTIKKENQNQVKGLKLELVQLMEQGDQVVKSPWSSWQIGTNYMYSKWNGTYKGYGDKKLTEAFVRDNSNSLDKYLEKLEDGKRFTYGATDLVMVSEPEAEIEVSAGVNPKIINKKEVSYTPKAPDGILPPFQPKLISPPEKPSAPVEVTPTTFDPPDINFKGKGFFQHAHIDISRGNGLSYGPNQGKWKGIVIQNYDTYNTVDKNNDTVEGIINIEVGNLADGKKAKWWGSNLDGTANSNIQLKVHTDVPKTAEGGYNFYGPGDFYLDDGSTTVPLYTFINELRDHNATISGNYIMTNKGGENDTSRNVIFLSHNPAGPGTPGYDGKNTAGPRTATFNGTLTLNGTHNHFTGNTASSDVTIGVEHQLYSRGHKKSYSIFDNRGTINLASGNNLVGILMDVESWDGEDRLSHKTINSGKIIVNSQNSIGIDYGEYYNLIFKSDLTIGNVTVRGTNNYGLRMANIFSGNAAYFDKGVTIKSGGADKKILVEGTENVGVSIAKFLSATKNSNPIANISDLNIEVAGQKNIGFLRHKTYANNSGDMIFDPNIMGTFTFGNGAKNSTLIRTDKYGIQVKKDITATGKDNVGKDYTGVGNTVLHSNGQTQHIHNYNTITVGKGYTQTVGMAATGTKESTIVNVLNEGSINLQGKKSIGMYVDKFTQGKSTGAIKLSALGDLDKDGNPGDTENVGISNKGKFSFLGDIEVNGKKSSGIYNTGTTTIEVGTNPTDKTNIIATNGATAIFSKGNGSSITSNAGNKLNINVNAGTTKEGLAVYAEDKSQVSLQNANITVKGGAAGVASYGVGTNVDLTDSSLKYDGNGYAAYSNSQGKINLTNSNIELRGSSTLMELDLSIPVVNRPITTTNTKVKVFSDDVVAMNLTNLGTKNLTDLIGLKSTLGVDITAGTEGGVTFNKYKEFAIENGMINFNVATDKKAAADTAAGFFFKRVLGQRLKLNINENLTARLDSDTANEFYGGQVVGVEANSSTQAISNSETQVNVAEGKTIDVARTDGTDKGGVGVFVNYGQVANKGTISVEKDSVANSDAIGVYAVNGSKVINEEKGKIDVSGKNSTGILGVAYRKGSDGKNIVDEFGAGAVGQGEIDILNKGQISLDGEGATGIFVKNNKEGATNAIAKAENATSGVITTTGVKSVGMSGEVAALANFGTINVNGQEGTGIFAKSSSLMENHGTINIVSSTSADKPNVGMFTEDQNTLIFNHKDILGGNNTYGIYGKTIKMTGGKISVGENSVGIFSNGEYTALGTDGVDLASGSEIEVGENESVGVFTTGKNQNISSKATMKIGDGSYGFVIKGTGTKLTTESPEVTVGNNTVFTYSTDTTGNIINKTKLTSTGSKNYGIYGAGTITNLADINFASGTGNVGIYSIGGGTAINGNSTEKPIIRVSGSDVENKNYGIGMAAGYTDDKGVTHQTGTVENYGTIKVEKDNGIGMYATGSGSMAINRGDIELSGKNTIGMYLDYGAIGENYGIIKTVANATNDGIIGVVAANGAVIKNYGTIKIEHGTNLKGVALVKKGEYSSESTGTVTPGVGTNQLNTSKKIQGVEIIAPGNGTATVKRNGKEVTPIGVNTVAPIPKPGKVTVGTTELDLKAANLADIPSGARASELGMYVDTSGVNYTKPIEGIEKLTNLKKINLMFGLEATRYTNSKDIKVEKNILDPYNEALSKASTNSSIKYGINSASLTWIATSTQDPSDDSFNAVYLSKIPYTSFTKDKDTYNFMDGLEQRYGVEGIGSREKALFDKLNSIGKGEPILLAQAVDEMKGSQYSNIEQRVNATGNILDEEFSYLTNEWTNKTKDSNKVKIFGANGEYKTNTAGVKDYKNYAYGVAYVHENEDVRLGKETGWYAGIVHNTFKFKDFGKSKEEILEAKIGLIKSVPFDENNSLNWTISGDVFAGYGKMHRKFLVVDEIFNAKSKYHIYGMGIKNELGKAFRLSEDFTFRPYIALKAEYGRVSKIREKTGEMKLEVKANDYISIKPEIGTDLSYRHYFGLKILKTTIGVAYENELGKVGSVKNKVKVADTSSDWYNLRGEKEDRKGNVKFDLNVGLDNQRIGVNANVGYDTKGANVRGGLGLRVIF